VVVVEGTDPVAPQATTGWNKGIVLDPFAGAGTTLLVAKRLGRHYLGFDINRQYVDLAKRRLNHSPSRHPDRHI